MNMEIGVLELADGQKPEVELPAWVCPQVDEDNSLFVDNELMKENYIFSDITDIQIEKIINFEDKIQKVSSAIKRIRGSRNEKVQIVRIFAPFSYLARYINPYKLYGVEYEQADILKNYLGILTEELVKYVSSLCEYENIVFSFSDPMGDITLCGIDYYLEYCLPYINSFLYNINPFLEKNVVHICGKLSRTLINLGGLKLSGTYIIEGPSLFYEVTRNPNIKYTGEKCIHVFY